MRLMNAYNVSYSVKISHDVYLFINTVCLFKKNNPVWVIDF